MANSKAKDIDLDEDAPADVLGNTTITSNEPSLKDKLNSDAQLANLQAMDYLRKAGGIPASANPAATQGLPVAPQILGQQDPASDDADDQLASRSPSSTDDSDDSEDDSDDSDSDSSDDPITTQAKKLHGLLAKYNKAKNPTQTDSLSQAQAAPRQSVSDLLSQLTGQQNGQLQAAQQQSAQQRLIAALGMGANQIGAALGRMPVNNDVYNAVNKDANQPIQNVLDQNKLAGDKIAQVSAVSKLQDQMDKSDPTSPISQQYRQLAGQLSGRPVGDNVSAEDLEKLSPLYEKMWQASQNALNRQAMFGNKQDQMDEKLQGQAQSELLKNKNYVDAQGREQKANALQDKIAQAYTNPVENAALPIELARAVVNSRINEQEIKAFGGSQAIMNKAQQLAGQMSSGKHLTPDDLNNMSQMVNILQTSAQNDQNQLKLQHAKNYSQRSGKSLSDSYATISGGDQFPEDVLNYASANNISPTKALSIKTTRTAGQGAPSDEDSE